MLLPIAPSHTGRGQREDSMSAPIVIEIKHRHTGAVLYAHKTTAERQSSGLAMRDALEAAHKAGANLGGANLGGADLGGADLGCADLHVANL